MNRREFIAAGVATGLMPASPLLAYACTARARFLGDLDLRADPDGRHMHLLKPYAYADSCGRVWRVPAGIRLDGASIPQIFWSVTGGPWSGRHRNASVIHDWYCDTHARPWREVHWMFYEAMISAGTDPRKAAALYAAVWVGGPRWRTPNRMNARLAARLPQLASEYTILEDGEATRADDVPSPAPDMTEAEFRALAERIEREALGPAQIESLFPDPAG